MQEGSRQPSHDPPAPRPPPPRRDNPPPSSPQQSNPPPPPPPIRQSIPPPPLPLSRRPNNPPPSLPPTRANNPPRPPPPNNAQNPPGHALQQGNPPAASSKPSRRGGEGKTPRWSAGKKKEGQALLNKLYGKRVGPRVSKKKDGGRRSRPGSITIYLLMLKVTSYCSA